MNARKIALIGAWFGGGLGMLMIGLILLGAFFPLEEVPPVPSVESPKVARYKPEENWAELFDSTKFRHVMAVDKPAPPDWDKGYVFPFQSIDRTEDKGLIYELNGKTYVGYGEAYGSQRKDGKVAPVLVFIKMIKGKMKASITKKNNRIDQVTINEGQNISFTSYTLLRATMLTDPSGNPSEGGWLVSSITFESEPGTFATFQYKIECNYDIAW